jgi:hypothetical protein
LGALGAFFIARWQLSRQREVEKNKKSQQLSLYFGRIKEELETNSNKVNGLVHTMKKSTHSRDDMWKWIISITESFSFESFRLLNDSGLQTELPENIQNEFYDLYNGLEDLLHQSNQAFAAHAFFLGFIGGQEQADAEFDSFKHSANKLHRSFEENLKVIQMHKLDS